LNANWPPFSQIINRETNHYFCLNDDLASLVKSQIESLFKNACDGEASVLPATLPRLLLQMKNNANYVLPHMNA